MTVRQTFLLVALNVAAAPGVMHAQAPAAAKCEIDDGKPGEVKNARDALVTAGILPKADDKKKQYIKAIGLVTSPKAAANPVGKNWILGRALVSIAASEGQPIVAPKASVGYAGNPPDNIDLLMAADSAFKAVEQAMPQCESQTEEYRRMLYVPLVNSAVNLYNAKQVDSAVVIAKRSLVIYPKSPVAYNVIANAAQSKEDIPGAIDAFQKMIVAIGTDTAYADEKKQVMLNMGSLLAAEADQAADPAKKKEYAKQAADAYQAYLKEYPGDAGAQSGLARAQLLAGDSTSANKIYADMLAAPDKFTDMQLFEAGVNAARADRAKDAAALFEAGLKKNPYYRDGLFNGAVTYLTSDQLDKMPPLLDKLIVVDPNNPENYRVWVNYYQDKVKLEKDATKKRALSDSVLKYYKLFSEPTVKVTFNLFSHDGTKTTIAGTIENLSPAAKSYTLKIDFLDNTGNSIASQEANVGPVDPKGNKPFRITVDKAGIVAFKYAPLDK
jgi:predicted Zn-dependent protease